MITDLFEFGDVQAHVAGLGDDELRQELLESDGRQREEAARQAALLAEYDKRKAYTSDGHASMRGTLRSRPDGTEIHSTTARADRTVGQDVRL